MCHHQFNCKGVGHSGLWDRALLVGSLVNLAWPFSRLSIVSQPRAKFSHLWGHQWDLVVAKPEGHHYTL